jgi:hypothetical protein
MWQLTRYESDLVAVHMRARTRLGTMHGFIEEIENGPGTRITEQCKP